VITAQATEVDWWGADAVCVRYGNRVALDRVTVHARPGAVTAVVGGDGAGRTTLLRCLAGALAVSAGTVRRPAQADIGYLPSGSGTYPDLTVTENLAFRAAAYHVPPQVAAKHGRRYLASAGLAGARDRLAGQLSGGMRQKLGVIAAMLHRPALLVLDEPTTGLDPVSRADLWALVAGAAADGAAVVLATSYLDEAERAAHVLVLAAGQQLAAGSADQIAAVMPGSLRVRNTRPPEREHPRAWRRQGRWRIWDPPGTPPGEGDPIRADLQDAVMVAILARGLPAAMGSQLPGEGAV
jgi:ABC-2 type transport system ATP-binding protein